jgi:hypothetical protein
MSHLVIPTRRVSGLEALELAAVYGLTLWLVTSSGLHDAMDASEAWRRIRAGSAQARDFYTFEPKQ